MDVHRLLLEHTHSLHPRVLDRGHQQRPLHHRWGPGPSQVNAGLHTKAHSLHHKVVLGSTVLALVEALRRIDYAHGYKDLLEEAHRVHRQLSPLEALRWAPVDGGLQTLQHLIAVTGPIHTLVEVPEVEQDRADQSAYLQDPNCVARDKGFKAVPVSLHGFTARGSLVDGSGILHL